MKLFFLRFRLMWQNSAGATLLLLLSFAAGFFCLNIYVGYGETQYGYTINISTQNAITIVDTEHTLENVELLSYLREKTKYRISDVLYMSKVQDNRLLVGWLGVNEGALWLPPGTGRFFTQAEIDSNEGGIIYLSDNLFSQLENWSTYKTGDFEYKVIGSSGVTNNIFVTADVLPYTDFWAGVDFFMEMEVLPYKAFLKRNLPPTLILVHMRGYTTKQRIRIADEFQQMFPGTKVLTNEWFDSAQYRWDTLVQYTKSGLRFSVLIWAVIASAFYLWLEKNKKVNRVLKICGISVAENGVQILLMLLLMVLLGEGGALLLQASLWPVLSLLEVKQYPPPAYMLISSVLLFLVVALVNLGGILRMARRVRESG